jgi:hypothetical protein
MSLSTIFQLYLGGQFLLVEKTGVPGENHQLAVSYWQTGISFKHYTTVSTIDSFEKRKKNSL